jgi:hypothetical protein
VLADLGGDEAHASAGHRQALRLAGTDPTPTDDEDRHVVEVEEDGIGERRRGFEGHPQQCTKAIPYKVDLFGRD